MLNMTRADPRSVNGELKNTTERDQDSRGEKGKYATLKRAKITKRETRSSIIRRFGGRVSEMTNEVRRESEMLLRRKLSGDIKTRNKEAKRKRLEGKRQAAEEGRNENIVGKVQVVKVKSEDIEMSGAGRGVTGGGGGACGKLYDIEHCRVPAFNVGGRV